MYDSFIVLIVGILFMYQWILTHRHSIFVRKQWKEHDCMNQWMEGTYECPYCYPDDYVMRK